MLLRTPEHAEALAAQGFTAQDATLFANFYQDIADQSAAKFADNPGKINPSAQARASLFYYIADYLGG